MYKIPQAAPQSSLTRPKSFNSYALSRTDAFANLEVQCEDKTWKAHRMVAGVFGKEQDWFVNEIIESKKIF